MPRSSSRRAPRLPVGLALLLLAGGWIYKQVLEPQAPQPRKGTTPKAAKRPSQPLPPLAPLPEYSPSAPSTSPREVEGKIQRDLVVSVYDGDTLTLQRNGKVRLIGIDTPEKSQPGGREAAAFAQNALTGKTIELEVCPKQPQDRYGRWLGFIYLLDSAGRRVLFNSEMVRQGYANVYSLRPCTVDEALWNSYKQEARQARRGLFATMNEIPDASAYRKSKRAR